MEHQLDNLFVVTEHINERLREKKTDVATELAKAIRVLPILQQKRIEDVVNHVYGEMPAQERSECLKRWDATEPFGVCIRSDCGNDDLHFYSSPEKANDILCKYYDNRPVRIEIESDYLDSKFEKRQLKPHWCTTPYPHSLQIRHHNSGEIIDIIVDNRLCAIISVNECVEIYGRLLPDGYVFPPEELALYFGAELHPSNIVLALQHYERVVVRSEKKTLIIIRIKMDENNPI